MPAEEVQSMFEEESQDKSVPSHSHLTITTSKIIVLPPYIHTDIAIDNATRIRGKRGKQGCNTNPFTAR